MKAIGNKVELSEVTITMDSIEAKVLLATADILTRTCSKHDEIVNESGASRQKVNATLMNIWDCLDDVVKLGKNESRCTR